MKQWEKYQEGEYYPIPKEIQKRYMDTSTVELIQLLDKWTTREWVDGRFSMVEEGIEPDQYDEYKNVLLLVAQRLELIQGYDALKIMYSQFQELTETIEQLEKKFKDHRHCLDKTYGEKPIW